MTEATVATFGGVDALDFVPRHVGILLYHHLADTFAIVDHKSLVRYIYDYYTDFAAIVGIDGAGSIDKCDAFF